MKPCEASMCPSAATHALLYGCLEQHIQEKYLCQLHVALFMSVTANMACWECGRPYLEWETGVLP